jgi:hypothetical protein
MFLQVKTSQEKFDEKFDDRLKNIEDSMLHFAQWKQVRASNSSHNNRLNCNFYIGAP